MKSELKVFAAVQDMINYIFTVTEKAPKKFRGNISDRLINSAFDMLESITYANAINYEASENMVEMYNKRKELQYKAVGEMRIIEQLSHIAHMQSAITIHQYEVLARHYSECFKLLLAWGKADKERYLKANGAM